MSETGTFTSRVADVLKRRETLRIAAPAGAAVVVVGVLLGVFLTGGDEPDETTGQSVEIADSTVESVSPAGEAEPTTADAGTIAPAEETAPATADAPTPAEPKPDEMVEAPPVPADVPGGDIDAGPEEEDTAEPAPAAPEKPTEADTGEMAEATPTPADPPDGDTAAVAQDDGAAGPGWCGRWRTCDHRDRRRQRNRRCRRDW